MAGELWTVDLGVVEYEAALSLQERVRDARQQELVPDVLLLVEHPPVYTRGRRTGEGELPLGEDWYRAQGIDVLDVDRGGKVTYHGPGQQVGYAIMRLTDVAAFVRTMEEAIMAALRDEGLDPRVRTEEGPAYTGVWVQDRKIASIGVHVNKGVTTHGFAVNVTNDLEPFSWVVPCGLPDAPMTSVAQERGPAADLDCFRKRIAHRFAEAHGRRQRLVTPQALDRALGAAVTSAR